MTIGERKLCCVSAILLPKLLLENGFGCLYANHAIQNKTARELGRNQAERMATLPSTVEPELGNASGGIVIYDTIRYHVSIGYPYLFFSRVWRRMLPCGAFSWRGDSFASHRKVHTRATMTKEVLLCPHHPVTPRFP